MPRILHIEDDPANRLLVRKLLVNSGMEVVDAADGLEGIRKALESPPDLILVDIAIPGLDGYEVTLRLRAEPTLAHTPIVAITAEGNRDTSLAVGCDGFLQKPIDARSFSTTLRGYLDGHREKTSPDRTGQHLRMQSQKIAGHLERKIAELSAANERLIELDNARRQFYRNISHELSTPMTPIVGYVKLLRDEELGPLAQPQLKALCAMEDCVQRLRGIIDGLLDVTGLETGRLRFVHRDYDLVQVVRRSVERSQSKLERNGCRLVHEWPPAALRGRGDAERLGRALDHLLDNAAKFTPSGGTVGVRVRPLTSGHFEVYIADTGPGVSDDVVGRIFDPFFQADGSPTRAHGGTGVGLAVVRGIARGHGGDVRVVSPAPERVAGHDFPGAGFYLLVAESAPNVAPQAL